MVKLQQSQVWKSGKEFIRIVRVERLEVEFLSLSSLQASKSTRRIVTKKEFCRLIKSAALLSQEEILRLQGKSRAD